MTHHHTLHERTSEPNRHDLLDRLRAVPEMLRRMLGDRSVDELQQPGSDGGVAIVEILCHLQDWEEITGDRVWRIVHEDAPRLESFDDSLWSIEHDYASRDGHAAISAFAIARAACVDTLSELDDAGWQRMAELEGHGQITLEWLMTRHADHDAASLERIVEAGR
jgi:hypothetical protein